MMTKVYSVYDSKANAYLPPMFFQNAAVAQRSFTAAAIDAKHDFNRFAADYTLFELGEWDDGSGKFHQYAAPVNLGTALEAKSAAEL